MAPKSSSKKRKHVEVVDEPDSYKLRPSADVEVQEYIPAPILVLSSTVKLPLSTKFDIYGHARDRTRNFIHGDSGKVEWDSSNWQDEEAGGSRGQSCGLA